jgi:putative transferase (TIGR04331 family)
VFIDTDWDADELFGKVAELEEILPNLEIFCAEVASELSGLTVTPLMFRRMGGMWLMHLVHQVAAMQFAVESYSELEQVTVPFDSWTHHSQFLKSTDYRRQIWTLAHHLRARSAAKDFSYVVAMEPMTSMSKVRRTFEWIAQTFRNPTTKVMISRPYLKLSKSNRLRAITHSSGFAYWDDLGSVALLQPVVDTKQRNRLGSVASTNDLESKLRSLIPHVIPVAYGESLRSLSTYLASKYTRPKALYSANGSQFHLPYQILSAVWGEQGTQILSHQHGGHQGLDELCAGEAYEVRASDRHYTLGWTEDNRNTWALPAAMPQRVHRQEKQRLLLMSVSQTDVIYRLQPFCMPAHARRCIKETQDFLEKLVWPTIPVVRGSTKDLAALNPTTIFKHEDFHEVGTVSASRSALVLHNYFGVSWLETLAMDIPTVCFVPLGIHRFRAAAQPFIDALVRVGVVHYSGREAAEFVNSLRGDPSSWWRSSEVQEAREAFVARYANFSDNWLDAWQAEFESLLAE